MKSLILGLGNDILKDDGIGIHAARALKRSIQDEQVEIVESALGGLALLDLLPGYDRVIIIDAIVTGKGELGQIYEFELEELKSPAIAPSPHYAGLPEVLALAHELRLDFPSKVKIYAVEVADPYTVEEGLTEPIAQALPKLIKMVKSEIEKAAPNA